MGARLVTLVLARWTHVSDRAFRLLVRMAHTALDEPGAGGAPAGVYFGGRELLALTLRAQGGSTQTRYREVRTVLAELADAGAIERVHDGRPGSRAAYRLSLNDARGIDASAVDDAGDRRTVEGEIPPTLEGEIPPPRRGSDHRNGGGLTTPLSVRGTTEELSEDRSGSTTTELALPGVPGPGSNQEISDDDCPRCGVMLDPGGRCGNRRCRDPTLAEIIPLRLTA